ncbi:unnamed protein product [Notodromas monacha]|uniref:ATP synthase subunit b n=1 Tax=Notodromas monacha TaxID=399045 RepID=A0A7R9GA21_9CRUS|nr:unnamed protein product [Notodromas monacha]CAG0914889.1 unnamed protein product [Notodromas monacha]
MLSRFALNSSLPRVTCIRTCAVANTGDSGVERLIPAPTYPSKKAEQSPERDTKNFPRVKRPDEPGKCRLFFIPEEYFQFFYPKTGVTGPYVFGAGLMTYLFSKEIMVCEHEYYAGLTFALVIYMGIKLAGPELQTAINNGVKEEDDKYRNLKSNAVEVLEESIKDEKHAQWQAQGQKLLFDAKRENVAVQLEAAFRERQMAVYRAVKNRLDYKLEMDNVTRRFQHHHMVNWIVSQVRKSITPELEKKSINQSIQDLKNLAARV